MSPEATSQVSPNAFDTCTSPGDANAPKVTNSSTSVTELAEFAACDTSNSSENTDPPSDAGIGDKNAAAEKGVVADGELPDGGDSAAHTLRPYWIPAGLDLSNWPPKLVADVAGLINPLYLELVQAARSPMERQLHDRLPALVGDPGSARD